MAWRVTGLTASTLVRPAWRVTGLSVSTTAPAPVVKHRVLNLSATVTQVAPVVKHRVMTLSASVTAPLTLPAIVDVEPGTVVMITAPSYDGATYAAAGPLLDLRGAGNTRQFIAPPTISQTTYDIVWTISRTGEPNLSVTQRVTVLSATLRIVVNGAEVPAYWSDGLDPVLPANA